MKHLRRKLNNKDGVSILIALVGFLAAAMIAAVIVSAALTSAKRVADDKTENQAHLTLESAAQLVRDGIEDTKYTYGDTNAADGTFADEMGTAVAYVDTYDNSYSSGDNAFTLSLDSPALDTVAVSYVMESGDAIYDMIFTLSIAGADEEMYISVDGFLHNNDDTITWTVVSINNGSGA